MARFSNQYTKHDTIYGSQTITAVPGSSSKLMYGGGYTGLVLDINISAFTGTNITFTLEAYDEAAGAWFTVLGSGAKTTTGRFTLTVDPRVPASANAVAQTALHQKQRVTITATALTTCTFSVNATWIP